LVLDGRLFGDTYPRGERALAWIMALLEREAPAESVPYARFLDMFPPPMEVRFGRVSSDCPHGVAVWNSSCECRDGDWAGPLRAALDRFALAIDAHSQRLSKSLIKDLATLRRAWGPLRFRLSAKLTQEALDTACSVHPDPAEAKRILLIADAQRWRLEMLSASTWETDAIDGPGLLQALKCAARAIESIGRASSADRSTLEESLLADLSKVRGEGGADAATVYRRSAAPSAIDAESAAAHTALSTHVWRGPDPCKEPGAYRKFPRRIRSLVRRDLRRGKIERSFSAHAVSVRDLRDFTDQTYLVTVLRRGPVDIDCRLKSCTADEARSLAGDLDTAFLEGEDALATLLDEVFGIAHRSLDSMFPEERAALLRSIAPRRAPILVDRMKRWDRILRALRTDPTSLLSASELIAEANEEGAVPDSLPGISALRERIVQETSVFAGSNDDERIPILVSALEQASSSGLHLPLWELQDLGLEGLSRNDRSPKEDRRRLARLLDISDSVFVAVPEVEPDGH